MPIFKKLKNYTQIHKSVSFKVAYFMYFMVVVVVF